ncbi:MATE family efflux transporter [Rhodobacteraceae bacterium NNCM2]|nr:MATE family efflux transporter [Coraliihabitans acroporae]
MARPYRILTGSEREPTTPFHKRTHSFIRPSSCIDPYPEPPVRQPVEQSTLAVQSADDAGARTLKVSRSQQRASAAVSARAARTKRLLEAPIGRTLAWLAAPNVLAMFVTSAMSIAEGYFASQLGVSALAGLALVFPLVMLTQMLPSGSMGGAISSAVARSLGAGNAERAGELAVTAWLIAATLAIASGILMAVFGEQVFLMLGGGGAAVDAALSYAQVFFPGCLSIWLCHATLSVIRGTGNMAIPSTFLFFVALGSIPLSGALALGWGGFPALGMAGLAAGPVIAFGAGAIIAIAYVGSGMAGLSLAGALRHVRIGHLADILRVGLIASVNSVLTVLTIVLMVGAVGRFGEAALAGYGLGSRLEFLMIPVIFGVGAAMTSMVGANIGAGKRERALRIAWTGSFAAMAIVGSIGAVVAAYPDLWLRIFLDTAEVEALTAGRAYFQIVAPFYGFFALGMALYFASQGAGRLIWPTIAGLSRTGIAFGGALTLIALTDLGVSGVFVAIACGMFCYGLITALAVKITRWR